MQERSSPAQPGVVPAARRAAGTMFAALYGDLVPHPWRGADPEHDAYSLFLQRSLAMGWLDDAEPGDGLAVGNGLWSMNDAGWEHPLAGPGLVAWFQVQAEAVAADRPLPVQAFLRGAGDATQRAGALHLNAVQVLLPVQGLDADARPAYAAVPAMATRHWFGAGDPQARTPVTVAVNGGQDVSVRVVTGRLVEHLERLDQAVFNAASHEVRDPGTAPPAPFDDTFWNGPPGPDLLLDGTLSEWTCEAVGWLAEVLADSLSRLGVRSPVLLTVSRAAPASPGH